MQSEKKKTLLEKYEIPISHLDFAYVETCKNAREMEKIVHILRSGEEGYFPDLLRCSEEKLKLLKPDSKLFRYEENIKKSDILDKKELKPILDWTQDIKTKDSALNELKNEKQSLDLPSIRKLGKIELDKPSPEPAKPTPAASSQPAKAKESRIKSTDYSKWDKYDPDEEILRMDLDEERSKEEADLKISIKDKPATKKELKDEKQAMYERLQTQLKRLSQLEREQFADKHRLRGNEYFKAKEYDSAIEEYNCAILYDPENAARSYNNRAISYMKQSNYVAAIMDCEACLQLEPENIKARLRLADANYARGKRRESYYLYQRVLELDPENASAKQSLKNLNSQLGELAPASATRLMIEELKPDADAGKPKEKTEVKPPADKQTTVVKKVPPPVAKKPTLAKKPTVADAPPVKEYDLAELVKPNRVVNSKLVSAAQALGNKFQAPQGNSPKKPVQSNLPSNEAMPAMFRMPQDNLNTSNKLLIQEI
ncbi:sperm-associated antigen 1 [Drosophila kikkawai]|uniref:Sperm-associated antigen 1 n=1 Tax=Drosophila kikkawai TaxID=30033 RepID=A0A6P4I328_DROKI|nr:sperm-associated antigen 1 [Drosophila kikkawai]